MAFYAFKGLVPVVHPSAFVHPSAVIIGDVIIGEKCYVGPGAVIRGDWGRITLEYGCNVQENCVVHMFPGKHIIMQQGAHVGHGAIIHGAYLGKNCLIGMNAVVMDGAHIGDNCIVGALSLVKAEEVIPPNHLFVGNPGRIVRRLDDDQIAWKTQGTELYQQLPEDCKESLLPVEPLREMDSNRPSHSDHYQPWKKR